MKEFHLQLSAVGAHALRNVRHPCPRTKTCKEYGL